MATQATRYFKPATKWVGSTGLRTSIHYWVWTKGRGVWCVLVDGFKFNSEYTLMELIEVESPTECDGVPTRWDY